MAERTFGRTVRSHRTKAGLSQSKLGELIGRAPTTIRSWERDRSIPTDPDVLISLSAVLGVNERILFDKAGVEPPERETSPTVEQALATLEPEPESEVKQAETESEAAVVAEQLSLETEPTPPPSRSEPAPEVAPSFSQPPQPYVVTTPTPPTVEPSYMEDGSQRQLYRVRNLATVVLLVALVVVLLWALGNTFEALGSWWDDFFGQLHL